MASELMVVSSQVPAQIHELVDFIKVGREKLTAVRAELRAIDKLGLEDEKRQQVLEQARMLSERLLDAEVSLGEIMATLPEAPGKRTDLEELEDTAVPRSKKEILKQAGFSVKTAQRYEILAAHPDIVAQMKAAAREKGTVVSRTAILRAITDKTAPSYDKENLQLSDDEIMRVQSVMGDITILPDDSAVPIEEQKWEGNVLIIPPRSNIWPYIEKLWNSFDSITEAIVIVPAHINCYWYIRLMYMSNAVAYHDKIEVKTLDGNGTLEVEDDYAFAYIGKNAGHFLDRYKSGGWGHTLNKVVGLSYLPRKRKL